MPEGAPSDASVALTSSLLRRLQGQDSAAWERFLRLFGPLIFSWCRARWGLAPADAADVLQDVIARVMETIGHFRGGSFLAWLDAVTRSRVANHFRRNPAPSTGGSDAQRLVAALPDHRANPDPAAAAFGHAADSAPEQLGGVLRRAVDAIRARCSGPTWEAFWQVTALGRKPADVAADLGMTANAVYVANSRILHRLRVELGAV
jgi:RNA polymerase sigma-70 factor (ECF subfamily)